MKELTDQDIGIQPVASTNPEPVSPHTGTPVTGAYQFTKPKVLSDSDVGILDTTKELSDEDVGFTHDQSEQSRRVVEDLNTPKLATPGVAANVWEAINEPPKPVKDLSDLQRQVQAEDLDTKRKMRALAKKHGINPDTVAKMPGIAEQISQGLDNGVSDLAQTLISPLSLGTLGISAAAKPLQRVLSLAFASQMFSQVPDTAKAILDESKKPADERDYSKITEMIISGAGQVGFGTLAAAHGLKGLKFAPKLSTGKENENASEIKQATPVPELEVRPQVGEETPLRQQGEIAGTGAEEAPPVVAPPVEAESVLTPPATPAPKVPDPNWRVTVQPSEEIQPGKTMPGYVQIDDVTGGQNRWSSSPENLAKQGIAVPDFSKLPKGQYTYAEAVQKLAEKPAATPPEAAPISPESGQPVAPVTAAAPTPVPDIDLARQVLNKEGNLSVALLQRRQRMGFEKATAAVNALEQAGEISKQPEGFWTKTTPPVETPAAAPIQQPVTPETKFSPAANIQDARKRVADFWRQNATDIRTKDEYASHVTTDQKDKILADSLRYADEIEQGKHDGNLTIGQRINYELTGKEVPLLSPPVKPEQIQPTFDEAQRASDKKESIIAYTELTNNGRKTPVYGIPKKLGEDSFIVTSPGGSHQAIIQRPQPVGKISVGDTVEFEGKQIVVKRTSPDGSRVVVGKRSVPASQVRKISSRADEVEAMVKRTAAKVSPPIAEIGEPIRKEPVTEFKNENWTLNDIQRGATPDIQYKIAQHVASNSLIAEPFRKRASMEMVRIKSEHPEVTGTMGPEYEAPSKSGTELKIGDPLKIMGVDSVLADSHTENGMKYEIFNGAALGEKRSAIRATDLDSGNITTLKQYPDYDAALKDWNDVVKREKAWENTARGRSIYKSDLATENAKDEKVVAAMLASPSYPKLKAAYDRFRRSLHGKTYNPTVIERHPWDMLDSSSGVMNAKSAMAKTLRELETKVFSESGLPRKKPDSKFRGGTGVDWSKVEVEKPSEAPVSQAQKVEEALKTGGAKTAEQLSAELDIINHNVRRILGQGAKAGKFERIARGVYAMKNKNGSFVYVESTDSVAALPELAKRGVKADFVFLDPPYKTAAIQGGNRGIKNYNLISPEQFDTVVSAAKQMLRSEDSPIYYMFSQAPFGLKEMQRYTDVFEKNGFKLVARGGWSKTFQSGEPVTNVRGKVAEPEGIALFNQSGNMPDTEKLDLNFKLVRPPFAGKGGRQSQKPAELYSRLLGFHVEKVPAGERANFITVDPFAGTGGLAEASVKAGVSNISYEIDENAVKNFIEPKVEAAAQGAPQPSKLTEAEQRELTDLMVVREMRGKKLGALNTERIAELEAKRDGKPFTPIAEKVLSSGYESVDKFREDYAENHDAEVKETEEEFLNRRYCTGTIPNQHPITSE